MKNTILIAFAALLFSAQLKAQDYIKSSDIYLNINGRNTKFDEIKPKTINSLLGKPLKVKTAHVETTPELITTYTYAGGTVDFEKGGLDNIENSKIGWGFVFNINGKKTPVFAVGTDVALLNNPFPKSPQKKSENHISIWLKDPDGTVLDCYMAFDIKNGKIAAIRFIVDES